MALFSKTALFILKIIALLLAITALALVTFTSKQRTLGRTKATTVLNEAKLVESPLEDPKKGAVSFSELAPYLKYESGTSNQAVIYMNLASTNVSKKAETSKKDGK